MLNEMNKFVVFLDSDTLRYMYLSYTKERNYPVMNKLYTLLHEGFEKNLLVIPLSIDHIRPYVGENKIDSNFLNMMGELGQVQFLQRFTVRMLQLIRVINNFFEQSYKKEIWKDAFSSDPEERYYPGFNKYYAITAQNVIQSFDRERKHSQIINFIESFKEDKHAERIAEEHFMFLWQKFPDLIKPYLPTDGSSYFHMKRFFEYKEIKEIPEFHIISNILFSFFEVHGIEDIEYGLKDDILLASETIAAYMPYCNFYVTSGDIAELVNMTGINDAYNVKVYDNNENSLYKLMQDINDSLEKKQDSMKKEAGKTMFQRSKKRKLY